MYGFVLKPFKFCDKWKLAKIKKNCATHNFLMFPNENAINPPPEFSQKIITLTQFRSNDYPLFLNANPIEKGTE